MEPLDEKSIRQELLDRLAMLRASIAATAEDRKPVELDQQSVGRLSRMDSIQVQAMAQKSEQLKLREIARIKAALARLDAGDFGYCVTCGEDIAPGRLAADPAIPTCIQCASGAG